MTSWRRRPGWTAPAASWWTWRRAAATRAIYAIGDCTQRPLPLYGRTGRLESVPNAIEQAKQAAADICGRPPPPPEVPWFWSDQYDLRLQMAGLAFDVHEAVVRGDARRRPASPCSTWMPTTACWRWRR